MIAKQNIVTATCNMPRREQGWLDGMKSILTSFSPAVAKAVFDEENDSVALQQARTYFASNEFFDAWAKHVVQSTASDACIPLTAEELQAKGKVMQELFPVPFYLMSALLQKLATGQPPDLANPKRKRWNFIWDSMISFSIGKGTIDNMQVYMVTGDQAIVDAAKAAGVEDKVLSLKAYLKSVRWI